MKNNELRVVRRGRRKTGIRKRVMGDPSRPRLTVFRSNKHIYAQIVDDLSGRTLVHASSIDKSNRLSNGGNREAASAVGRALAERAVSEGISTVVFDRNGFLYHGRVQALATAAREGGLKF